VSVRQYEAIGRRSIASGWSLDLDHSGFDEIGERPSHLSIRQSGLLREEGLTRSSLSAVGVSMISERDCDVL